MTVNGDMAAGRSRPADRQTSSSWRCPADAGAGGRGDGVEVGGGVQPWIRWAPHGDSIVLTFGLCFCCYYCYLYFEMVPLLACFVAFNMFLWTGTMILSTAVTLTGVEDNGNYLVAASQHGGMCRGRKNLHSMLKEISLFCKLRAWDPSRIHTH